MSNTAPLGYKRVEYLESTGTQYIDTGFYANQDTKIIVDYIVKSMQTSNNGFIFGSRISNQNQNFSFTFDYNVVYIGRGSSYDAVGQTPTTINTRYNLEYAKTYVKRNDVIIDSQSASDFTTTNSLHIFNCNENGSNIRYVQAKIYSFKIYDNDILVRDYIPVLNENNEAGLYDLVNKQFYGNSGTGSFQYGDIIPEGTIAEKFNYSLEVKELIKDGINYLGGNVTDETTLKEYRDELDSVYAKLPKVTNSTASSSVTLNPTLKGRIDSTLKGQIGQDTTTGKNKFGFYDWYQDNNATHRIININKLEVTATGTNAYANSKFKVNLEDGTYTFSLGKVTNSNSEITTKRMTLAYYINNTRTAVQHIDKGTPQTITITNETGKEYILEFWGNFSTNIANTAIYEEVQIEPGSAKTEWEEYTGRNIKSKSKL